MLFVLLINEIEYFADLVSIYENTRGVHEHEKPPVKYRLHVIAMLEASYQATCATEAT